MKRAPIVVTATALGLGATLGFNAHRPETAATTTATTIQLSGGSSPSSAASGSSRSSSSRSSTATQTVTGDAVATPYGDVQLKVTVSDRKITAIEPVQLPSGEPKSQEISSYAAPQLGQSALSKQSANVDVVSGATYTSEGYRTALQSALDRAANTAATTSTGTTS